MKIVLTSDTHIPKKGRVLPGQLLKECKTADLIIHAGDWSSMNVYHTLSKFAEVKAVYGNVDSEEIKEYFPEKEMFVINGFNIGVFHGHGEKKTTEKRVLEAFQEDSVDIIVFGHSHIPLVRYVKKTLLINPGSPMDKRMLPYYSYGILHLTDIIKSEIIFFS